MFHAVSSLGCPLIVKWMHVCCSAADTCHLCIIYLPYFLIQWVGSVHLVLRGDPFTYCAGSNGISLVDEGAIAIPSLWLTVKRKMPWRTACWLFLNSEPYRTCDSWNTKRQMNQNNICLQQSQELERMVSWSSRSASCSTFPRFCGCLVSNPWIFCRAFLLYG